MALHATNSDGKSAKALAEAKAKNWGSWDMFNENECMLIFKALEANEEELTARAIALDEERNPAIILLRETFRDFVGLEVQHQPRI